MAVFWDVAPRSLVQIGRRFRGAYYLTSNLKMETACFSETLASTYDSKRRQNPKEQQHQIIRNQLIL
jgi:hypothetical protein